MMDDLLKLFLNRVTLGFISHHFGWQCQVGIYLSNSHIKRNGKMYFLICVWNQSFFFKIYFFQHHSLKHIRNTFWTNFASHFFFSIEFELNWISCKFNLMKFEFNGIWISFNALLGMHVVFIDVRTKKERKILSCA